MSRKATPWFRRLKRKSGITGRWYVHIDGKQTALPVTDPNGETAAIAAFLKILENREANKFRPEPLAVLIPQFLESRRHKAKPKTIIGYAAHLRWFAAHFGNVCTVNLDADAVEKRASEEKWSDSHRCNVLWTAQALVQWAGRKDFKLDLPTKESRGSEAVISEAVYARILRETKGDFYQLVRLLWAVGSRPMESGHLVAEMIDWVTGTISWREHKTKKKTGRKRIIYLNSDALTILREQCDKYPTGALFRGLYGQPLTLQAVMVRMIRLSKKIGHHVTAGHFRHTFATRALQAGIPDTTVAALLGHTSTRMVHKHYSHVAENSRLLRDAAEKLAG